jgi:hypothetical protein
MCAASLIADMPFNSRQRATPVHGGTLEASLEALIVLMFRTYATPGDIRCCPKT